jgi:hypothetical protein
MLSHGFIGVLQEGHLDEGIMIDNPLGILYMQTLRKEPTTSPKRKTIKYGIKAYISKGAAYF